MGEHVVILSDMHGPYYDAAGKRRATNRLSPGETLMIYEQELRGQTFVLGEDGAEWLGCGRVVKPEHRDKSDEELLGVLGYQFHAPRSDFAEIESAPPDDKKEEKAGERAQTPAPAMQEEKTPALLVAGVPIVCETEQAVVGEQGEALAQSASGEGEEEAS